MRVRSSFTVALGDRRTTGGLTYPGLAGRFVAVVPTVGERADGLDQVVHRGVGSAADGLLSDDAEGDFDQVQPGVGMIGRWWSVGWVQAWPMQCRGAFGQVTVKPPDVSDLGLPL
ncbi:MAG: hypothetical protein ACRD0H_02445, partial [Actinomycetes bacterium]